MSEGTVRGNRREIPISHPERDVFPEAGVTKLDLARHYADVAERMVPLVRDRPLALQSFPRGIEDGGYFIKNAPGHFPDWIPRVEVPKREGGAITQVVANDADTLVYLAGQNVITPHIWTSRADRLERPDRIIFDLDPTRHDFAEVRAAARQFGELLRDLDLHPFAMTTGSRGLHVVVPLRRTADYEDVNAFARAAAGALADEHPDALTTEWRKEKRGDRLLIDVNRNRYGQHAVAPYSVRPRPTAPVATPLRWAELDDGGLAPDGWTVRTIGERLGQPDPWADLSRCAKGLSAARKALAKRAPTGTSA